MENRKIELKKGMDYEKIAMGVVESYHNDTDVYSEAIQNAVDSIFESKVKNPKLEITLNKAEGWFQIKDNGLGMDEEDLFGFALGRTHKTGKRLSGGLGVGASYLLYNSDKIIIESVKKGKKILVHCDYAYKKTKNHESSNFDIDEIKDVNEDNYTKITLWGENFSFKDYESIDEFVRMLRTKTAIGYTKVLFQDNEDYKIDIEINFIDWDKEGNEIKKQEKPPFRYWHIAEAKDSNSVPYEDVSTDENYSNHLLSYKDDKKMVWATLSNPKILHKNEIEPGIFVSIRGIPQNVTIRSPKTGFSGYWKNIFMLINIDDAKIDLGIKTISKQDENLIRELAKEVFNKLLKRANLFIATQLESDLQMVAMDQLKEEVLSYEDLNIPQVNFLKKPTKEQSVIAIFHELIGSGTLSNYKTLFSAQDAKYDSIIKYESNISELGEEKRKEYLKSLRTAKMNPNKFKKNLIVEFKLDLEDFIKDKNKDLKEVDLIVAWDMTKTKLKQGWKFEDLDEKELMYSGAKHKLLNNFNDSAHVILIKDFIDKDVVNLKRLKKEINLE